MNYISIGCTAEHKRDLPRLRTPSAILAATDQQTHLKRRKKVRLETVIVEELLDPIVANAGETPAL